MPRPNPDRPDVHYDRVSRAWQILMGESFHYGYFSGPDDTLEVASQALTNRMAEAAALTEDQRVLDIGCGIGAPALAISRQFGCRVVGISTSRVGVELARDRAAAMGLGSRVDFQVRDGMNPGMPDASFDCVWILESSHLMPDKAALIRQGARLLRTGGSLVLCDVITPRDLPLREVLRRAEVFDLLRTVFGRAKMETLDTYQALLRSAGLQVLCCDDLSLETLPTLASWRENAEHNRESLVQELGETRWSDFVRACTELESLWKDGVLGYGLVAARKPETGETVSEEADD